MTAEQVRAFRQLLGASQRELAERLGVGTRTIQDWESGRRNAPYYLRYAASALLLGVPPWPVE